MSTAVPLFENDISSEEDSRTASFLDIRKFTSSNHLRNENAEISL